MDDKKKNKNKSPAWAIIVILYVAIKIMADADTMDASLIIIVLCLIAVIVGVTSMMKKAKAQRGEKPQSPRTSQPAARKEKPMRLRQQERAAFPQRRESYTPDNGDKYIAQLNGFLKNGIIDAKEYKFMLERYKRNGNIQ